MLSKVQNRGSPNGPPMVDGWYMLWSETTIKPLWWLLCRLFSTITRACILSKIFLSLGRTRFLFKVFQSFWNLIGGLRWPTTSGAKLPVNFQSDWSIFPNYTQLLNCEKSVANLLVAKRTTQGANMGCPFHLWVAFGYRATVFGQHCICNSQYLISLVQNQIW